MKAMRKRKCVLLSEIAEESSSYMTEDYFQLLSSCDSVYTYGTANSLV